MASVLNQRRNSVFSDTKESQGKVRDADNMNDSFRIWFNNSERQHQLSAHHDIEQSFCVISGWKVLAQNIFCLNVGKTVESTLFLIISVLNILPRKI